MTPEAQLSPFMSESLVANQLWGHYRLAGELQIFACRVESFAVDDVSDLYVVELGGRLAGPRRAIATPWPTRLSN